MGVLRGSLLASSGLLVVAATAAVAQSEPQSTPQAADDLGLEEIIVTARRRAESLQDVPQTIDAVGSEEIEKLSLQKFEDVQSIVPGLTLSSGASGYTTAATVRGASFQVESSATPTVEFYLNDGPIQSIFLFQQMYDLGQIEVLRGPQGTLRGRAAPSGSITVTTRRPDLSEFGGYANVLGTDENAVMTQGAVNIPLITDSLALRVAGLYDDNDYDHVEDVNGTKPSQKTKSGRVSLRWDAAGDTVSTNLMYQYMERDQNVFRGYQSFSLSEPSAPVVQPTIAADNRLSILDGASSSNQKFDILTAQVDWRFAGQQLSYVGTYNEFELLALEPQDLGNVVPNFEFFNLTDSDAKTQAHELRLASEERQFGFLDYTAGVFHQNFSSPSDLITRTLIGIQTGPYTLLSPVAPVETPVARRNKTEETSVFANLTFHIGEKTEVSGGARYIDFQGDSSLAVNGATLSQDSTDEKPVIWNLAASHHVTKDFMVYGNVGTSWRDGPSVVGIFRRPTPLLTQFTDLNSEDSTSYELGFKADFLNRRLRLNMSAFHQDFKDFIYRGPLVWYVNIGRTGAVPAQFNFDSNVDAKVNGVEADLAFLATERLNVGLSFSYAKGEMDNGVVACNDFDGNGVPDQRVLTSPTVAQILAAAGSTDPLVEAVAACTVNDRLSFAPDWSATLQSEYTMPITSKLTGFGRGLYSYYTSNEQDPNNIYDNVGSYGLLNLYGGVRSSDDIWEVSLFVRNALDTDKVLNRSNGPLATPYTTTTGVGTSLAGSYMGASVTPPREIGLSVRYAFGSR